MLQADLGLFLLFYHKSRFAGVFILVFSAHLFASCGVVWYEKKRLPPFSGAALLKIQVRDALTSLAQKQKELIMNGVPTKDIVEQVLVPKDE